MGRPGADFVHLDCLSCFSFRRGASHPEELVARAVELGYDSLALTDWHGPYGAPRFALAARAAGLRPIIGATVSLQPGGRLLLLVRDAAGWTTLCRVLSAANLAGTKERPQLTLPTLALHTSGLTALVGPQSLIAERLLAGDDAGAAAALAELQALFAGGVWLELVDHHQPLDRRRNRLLARLGQECGVGVVATNLVHYATPVDGPLADVFTSLREHTNLPAAGRRLAPNHEAYLTSAAEMGARFAWCPSALANARRIADQCRFQLDQLPAQLPPIPLPPGETPFSYLHRLATDGARERYRPLTAAVARQLAHELEVIDRLGFAGYFLLVWDICRFARERGILCQGRGSAANSLVAYCLFITNVDPIRLELLFERFLSDGRSDPPDIDIDIANDRREEVLQYVYTKYGRDRAAMVAEYICYRERLAVREVGRALGLPADRLTAFAQDLGDAAAGTVADPLSDHLRALCARMDGMPRHLGIHSGGLLITDRPLVDLVPVERARRDGRTVIGWDKDDLETLGLCKVDLLALGMLALLGTACRLIAEHHGLTLDLGRLPPDDPSVYDLLCQADTVGVFQVESRAQMALAPRLQPRCFADLVIAVALVRPGPIQGGSVHPYLRRRRGEEPVVAPHPLAEPILARTLGCTLFQEQGMRLAMAVGGFSAAEADGLRRAMSKGRSAAAMRRLEERFHTGAAARGVEPAAAATIWRQLASFADYGFPESHAASFALLVYQSAYLKRYYPAAYACAHLNHLPMGFYGIDTVVNDARRRGIAILPPDIQRSRLAWTLEPQPGGGWGLRTGLRAVRGIGPEAPALEAALAAGTGRDLAELRQRTGLTRAALANLARCGALAGLGLDRRSALWAVQAPPPSAGQLPGLLPPAPSPDFAPMTLAEELIEDYRLLGFSPHGHLLTLWRAALARRGVRPLAELAHGRPGERVRVAGMAAIVQRPPTAHGMGFVTLEDESGLGQAILRPAQTRQYHGLLREHPLVIVDGTLQQADGATSVLVQRLTPLSGQLDPGDDHRQGGPLRPSDRGAAARPSHPR